jgi:beta-lactamase regulating signal transducer with metallopeptidase domain
MIPVLIEAAFRALVVALIVWGGLRFLRVSNVMAQKAAWGLVLACAVAMPLIMRWQVLPPSMALRVQVRLGQMSSPIQNTAPSHADGMAASQESFLLAKTELAKTEPSPKDRRAALTVSDYKVDSRDQVQLPDKLAEGAETVAATYIDVLHARTETPAEFIFSRMRGWTAAVVRNIGTLCWLFYLAVCGVLLTRIGYGLNQAMELWQRAEVFVPYPQDDPGFGLRMRFSRAVSSPVTIGSGVLLPCECLEWNAEKLRIVLAHERSHVRQGDFYLQTLAEVYAAVFWFSPLGWWLKRKLSDLGEAISDRAGLEEAASRASYAQVLLEFAALPRPTVAGVAMARASNLSHRIERFLNESSFRRAFAGSRRRILLAILLVPIAVFAGTALIRVEAAASGQAVPPAPPAASAPEAPAAQAVPAAPAEASAPAAPALAPPGPDAPALAPVSPDAPAAPVPPLPPAGSQNGEIHVAADGGAVAIADDQDESNSTNTTTINGRRSTSAGHGYSYSYSSNGDSWALITDGSEHVNFSGDWNDSARDTIEKVRKLTGGKFLWFTHGGKSYFIDDAAIIDQIQAMYKPMEALGKQQEVLGKQQEELGRQQEELGRKQEQASIPTPDISKEMAKLNDAVARLDAKKGSTVSQDELADLEGKLGEIQGRLGELEGQVGAMQGEFGAQQGKLGAEQGKLGAEQGRLGAEQGRIASEADRKVRSIIDQNLRDGKARPVE